MMPMKRTRETPGPLLENASRWAADYATKKRTNPAFKFRWPEVIHEGRRVSLNRLLLADLLEATAHHCAYCDGFPVGETSRETIDHFRPKGLEPFFHLAFEWANLFPACDKCQDEKRDRFDERLLKPDAPGYDFDLYFDFNAKTGELEPNLRAGLEDQSKALVTIATFGLNTAPRCASRLRHFERHYRDAILLAPADLDDLPYRYLAPPPL